MVMTNNKLKFMAMAKYKKSENETGQFYNHLDTHDETHLSCSLCNAYYGKNYIRKS